MYVNLSAANRVAAGNWFLAPFYSIKVSLAGEGSPDTSAILEFDRLAVPTEDAQRTVIAFVKQKLPASLSRAFPQRCAAPR